MFHRHGLSVITTFCGNLIQRQTRLAILILSLFLVGCGGSNERPVPSEKSTADGVLPRITGANVNSVRGEREVFARASNKCNLGKTVSIDHEVLIEVNASESVLPPNVMISGVQVEMIGKNYKWQGTFDMDELPGVEEYVHNDYIPYEISVTDSSGETSALLESANDLQFCVQDAPVGNNGDLADCSCYPEDISGVWKLRNQANAIGVGQSSGVTQDWSISDVDLQTRHCVFDDTYTFDLDESDPLQKNGTFKIEMDGFTWLETWQNVEGVEKCGIPVSPFDGLNPETGETQEFGYVWNREERSLKLEGIGAHIGLPRVANLKENKNGTATYVDYTLETANNCLITLNIKSGGPSPWWHFEIEKVEELDGSTPDCNVDSSSYVSVSVPSIPSADYNNGMPDGTLLDLTFPYSSDPDSNTQPSVESDGTVFSVPNVYRPLYDGDDDGVADNPDAFAGFASDPNSKLYSWSGAIAGQAYLDAVDDSASADESLSNATADLLSDPTNLVKLQVKEDAAQAAKEAAKTLRDADYFSNDLTFGKDGFIYFRARVPNNGTATVKFKIDNYEIDPISGEFALDTDGNQILVHEPIETAPILIKGDVLGLYGVKVESTEKQGNKIAMIIDHVDPLETNVEVEIKNITIQTSDPIDAFNRGPYRFTAVFHNTKLVGDDPDTVETEDDAELGADGKLLGENNTWPVPVPTNDGTTFLVPSVYDGNENGIVDIFDDPSGNRYVGFGLDVNAIPDLVNRPLTFGDGLGLIRFMASVDSGSADVSFRFEKIASEVSLNTEPSCTVEQTIEGSIAKEYVLVVPKQGIREFKHAVMYIHNTNKEVTISDITFETSPADPTVDPVDCGSDAAQYGVKILDMTAPYGDAMVDPDPDGKGALFRVDSEGDAGFAGFAVNGNGGETVLELAPAAFGAVGGYITFTASIPTTQISSNAFTTADLYFKLEREGSEEENTCKTDPSYETAPITISAAENIYTIDIPPQGFNTFKNFVMILETEDTQVQIHDSTIRLNTSPPTLGIYVPPAECKASPYPSEYFENAITLTDFDGDGIDDDVDTDIDNDGLRQEDDPATEVVEELDTYNYDVGFSGAAFFRGTYGGTRQSGDLYTFASEGLHYGGWSNDNSSLNPLKFAQTTPPFFEFGPGPARIAFCASAPVPAQGETDTGDVSVTFKFENNPYPRNSQQVLTDAVAVPRDGVKRPYMAFLTDAENIAVSQFTHSDGTLTPAEFPKDAYPNLASPNNVVLTREFTSLQMYIDKRDVAVTIGKIMGNWDDGTDQLFFSKNSNLNATDLEASNYCGDFPVADTDGDGVKDSRDQYPDDATRASNNDLDDDGTDDLLDGDIDGDGILNENDEEPYVKKPTD